MNDDNLPARRIVIKLTSRQKSDSHEILEAVRDALTPHGISLRVDTLKPQHDGQVVEEEPLGTRARELAGRILDREAAKAEKETMTDVRETERMAAEIVAQRAGAKEYLIFLTAKGVRITVELYENGAKAFIEIFRYFRKLVSSEKQDE